MAKRDLLIAGNWKMNGSKESVYNLISGVVDGTTDISNIDIAVCPPSIFIPMVSELAAKSNNIKVGAQNSCIETSGAYTGELSVQMIENFDCKYCIIGHSERRTLYGESDEVVAEKFNTVQQSKLIPILCIGETLEERESNITEQVLAQQLDAISEKNGNDAFANCVIAYEPVWAIGTGKTATPEQAQQAHAFIRQHLAKIQAEHAQAVQILYGGSMNATNARELLSQQDIDGGLIGGASLKVDDFVTICQTAKELSL